MSHNTLIEKIEHDTKSAVAEIESKKAAAVAVIESETKKMIAELEAVAEKEVEKKLQHLALVSLAKAKQNSNITIQTAKRREIDEVFQTVAGSISTLSADEYVAFFSAMVESVVPKKVEATMVHAASGREAETKKILHAVGISIEATVHKNVTAGVIVHTKDGVYDATLQRLMSEKQAELEMKVVSLLNA